MCDIGGNSASCSTKTPCQRPNVKGGELDSNAREGRRTEEGRTNPMIGSQVVNLLVEGCHPYLAKEKSIGRWSDGWRRMRAKR